MVGYGHSLVWEGALAVDVSLLETSGTPSQMRHFHGESQMHVLLRTSILTGVMTDGLMVVEDSKVAVAPEEGMVGTDTRSSTKPAKQAQCEWDRDTRMCRRLEILADRRWRL